MACKAIPPHNHGLPSARATSVAPPEVSNRAVAPFLSSKCAVDEQSTLSRMIGSARIEEFMMDPSVRSEFVRGSRAVPFASSIVLAHPLFVWLRRWLAGQQGFLASFERPKGAVSQNQRSVNGERVRCVILTEMCDAN